MVQRSEPVTFQEIQEGLVRVASARVDVSADGTEQFVIKSPSTTDKKAEILSIAFRTEGFFLLDYKTGFSIDTNGTSFDVMNAKTGDSDSTDLTIEYGGSYSGMSTVGETVIPGSTEKKGAGSGLDLTELIVSNGTGLMFELTNQNDSQAQFVSVVAVFVEKPG